MMPIASAPASAGASSHRRTGAARTQRAVPMTAMAVPINVLKVRWAVSITSATSASGQIASTFVDALRRRQEQQPDELPDGRAEHPRDDQPAVTSRRQPPARVAEHERAERGEPGDREHFAQRVEVGGVELLEHLRDEVEEARQRQQLADARVRIRPALPRDQSAGDERPADATIDQRDPRGIVEQGEPDEQHDRADRPKPPPHDAILRARVHHVQRAHPATVNTATRSPSRQLSTPDRAAQRSSPPAGSRRRRRAGLRRRDWRTAAAFPPGR